MLFHDIHNFTLVGTNLSLTDPFCQASCQASLPICAAPKVHPDPLLLFGSSRRCGGQLQKCRVGEGSLQERRQWEKALRRVPAQHHQQRSYWVTVIL